MAKMITTKEAATRLGVDPSRVLALIKADRLPAQKIGRDWLIDPDDLAKVEHRPNGYPKGKPRQARSQ